jgi:hypothetical protein
MLEAILSVKTGFEVIVCRGCIPVATLVRCVISALIHGDLRLLVYFRMSRLVADFVTRTFLNTNQQQQHP